MLNIITAVISFIILVLFISTVRFVFKEGKDERGNKIIGGAGIIALFAFLFGYSVTFTINLLHPLTGSQYGLALNFIFDFVLLTYSIMIMVLRRVY